MHKHNNYLRVLMPTKKSNNNEEAPKTEEAKAVVSQLGVNDPNPVSGNKGDVVTKNGNTLTFN